MDDFGLLVGRHFTALPTLVDEESGELQLDEKGRLIIAGRWLAGNTAYAVDQSGVSALAVRQDATGPLAGVDDGEYTPFQVDENGRLKAVVVLDDNGQGTYSYAITDGLTDDEDGLEDITGAYTTVTTIDVADGEILFVYGWQWDSDKNATARLIRKVTGSPDVITVYKVQNNSSAMPGRDEHWGDSARIEIAGADDVTFELQIKTRGSGAGANGKGTGSIHARKA
tara:strand:- start:3894 stop:4571 length:678 start_codon:yes stop_codon:yes gene_type:complete